MSAINSVVKESPPHHLEFVDDILWNIIHYYTLKQG